MKSWLPDLIYLDGAFRSGIAMFADDGGRIQRFSSDPADLAKAQRLVSLAMLPGLVNVHSHAFQRVIRGRTEQRTAAQRDTFWTWREAMYRAANRLTPEGMYHAARMAFLEMLRSGITTVGEFHYVHHAPGGAPYQDRNLMALEVARAAADTGLRIVLLRCAYARAGFGRAADTAQARFYTPGPADFIADAETLRTAIAATYPPGRASVGIAPHSIRAVPLDYLCELVQYAREREMPVHMHVAEQPAEVQACIAEYGLRPVALLGRQGLLDSRFTAIHAIHIDDEEVALLGDANSIVGACPTTERNLGDGVSPADRLLNAGVRICFGSDSNVQIDLLEDARSLEYDLRMSRLERVVLATGPEPEALAKRLLQSATESGAASLQSPGGALEVGRPADFFTVDLNDASLAGAGRESLANHIVFSLERTAIRDVAVDGEFVVRDGRHPLAEEITRQFAALQKTLRESG
ncbi:MAG: formimidoylglutamate deiminase [Bryobacteraceae bacterium]|jgi:formimidoylglutamate deiminase